MSSFEQSLNQHRQFVIAVKVFPPTDNPGDYAAISKNAIGYRALVDTGANTCSISQKIVTDLKLQPHSGRQVMTAGGPLTTSVYLVGLAVSVTETRIHPQKQKDGSTIMVPVVVSESSAGLPEIKVTSFPDIGTDRGFDVILGMDILMNFHITMCHGKIIISI